MNKTEFLKYYHVEEAFANSGLRWETLEDIHTDYISRENEINQCTQDLEHYIKKNLTASVHSLRCRKKDPEHLIEKIIRKRGIEQNAKYRGINVQNYREIIRDLIGVRILILSKEEWKEVYDDILSMFAPSPVKDSMHFIAEQPVAYTRYGDRNIFTDQIRVEHSNKGYRSQHYIVKFNQYYCEIQVRTLTEEVYGEFDHKVKYPYRNDNNFLIRYTSTLSQLLGSVDELISTCFQMRPEGWEQCNSYYSGDCYIDWKSISKPSNAHIQRSKEHASFNENGKINSKDYFNRIILRKD